MKTLYLEPKYGFKKFIKANIRNKLGSPIYSTFSNINTGHGLGIPSKRKTVLFEILSQQGGEVKAPVSGERGARRHWLIHY